MPGWKRLAYGEGERLEARKPKFVKTLVFGATFFAAMAACAPATNAIPARDPAAIEARRVPSARPGQRERAPIAEPVRLSEPFCRMRGRTLEYSTGSAIVSLSNFLEDGERLREIACRGERAFVLTDRSLLIVRPGGGMDLDDDGIDIRFVAAYSRTDMRGILQPGLVAWTQSDDTVFFLARNGALTLLPIENMGDSIPSFTIPYDVAGARMTHHGGYLFLATRSEMVVVRAPESRTLPLRTTLSSPAFYTSGGSLFFGKRGVEENEIRIGERIDEVSLVRR
ncbi:MAG: hypothetical protein AB1324_05130 [Candidatus Micrarchaeota archaeon]